MNKYLLRSAFILYAGFLLSLHPAAQQLPEIIPASPVAQQFNKFGEVPVGHTSGIPDVSIPLYTIRQGDIEVPIVLRYHYNGFKPGDPNLTNVALGWTLHVGGNINRSIRGQADDLVKKAPWTDTEFLSKNENVSDDYLNLFDFHDNSNYDSKYDIFSYHFNGRSGHFILEDKGNKIFEATNFPFAPIKITSYTTNASMSHHYCKLSGFDLTDENGKRYNFGFGNTASVSGILGLSVDHTSDWYLNSIYGQNNSDRVHFFYEEIDHFYIAGTPYKDSYLSSSDDYYVIRDGESETDPCDVANEPGPDHPLNNYNCGMSGGGIVSLSGSRYVGMKNLKQITFPNGQVDFELSADNKYIRGITVKDTQGNTIKSFVFLNNQDFTTYARPKLKGIQVKDGLGILVEGYAFTYENSVPFDMTNYSIDYWGYYNGTKSLNGYCATKDFDVKIHECNQSYTSTINWTGANMQPVPDLAKAFILKSITYPTKGTTTFEYEGNQYKYTHEPVQDGGGLRVKKISSSTNEGYIEQKEYFYEPYFLNFHPATNSVTTRFSMKKVTTVNLTNFYKLSRERVFYSGWNPVLGDNSVRYRNVTEYHGTTLSNTGKTEYSYSSVLGNTEGMLEQLLQVPNGPNVTYSSPCILTYNCWGDGLLESRTQYKADDAGNYTKVKKTENNYAHYPSYITEKNIFRFGNITKGTLGDEFTAKNIFLKNNFFGYAPSIYHKHITSVKLGGYYLESTIESIFNENAEPSVQKTTFEHANPLHRLLNRKEHEASNGDLLISKYKYPQDMTGEPYTSMVGENILAPVIEQRDLVKKAGETSETLLETLYKQYKDWGNGLYLPGLIKTATYDETPETRLVFDKYDSRGNLLQAHKANDINMVYLWDGTGNYPMAKIENATHAQVSSLDGKDCTYNSKTLYNSIKALVPGAMITTFSYKPLVGMTSQTGPNGITVYYGYDAFGRLEYIKDNNGKILGYYNYHYAGQ